MLAIHNILAASATVNLHGKEGEIIKRIFFISIIYALIAGLIGLIIIKFIG
jgi:L-lactate permease